MASSSAPGKIILFGEHAVVYGQPAIAVPVTQVQATAHVRPVEDERQRVISRSAGLDAYLDESLPGFWGAEVVRGLQQLLGIGKLPAFELEIFSDIPIAAGMGSGAAIAVASIRALAAFLDQPISDGQVNAIAFEIEKLHHGTPSGVDNTVVTYACPVYFVRGQPVETFRPAEAFTVVIADTGVPSPTALSVGDVRRAWSASPERYNRIFGRIGEISRQARSAIAAGSLPELGPLMDENHRWLYEIGVSSPELEGLVNAARRAGALGAKLSGGGRGGNMLALAEPENLDAVEAALQAAGAARSFRTTIGSA